MAAYQGGNYRDRPWCLILAKTYTESMVGGHILCLRKVLALRRSLSCLCQKNATIGAPMGHFDLKLSKLSRENIDRPRVIYGQPCWTYGLITSKLYKDMRYITHPMECAMNSQTHQPVR